MTWQTHRKAPLSALYTVIIVAVLPAWDECVPKAPGCPRERDPVSIVRQWHGAGGGSIAVRRESGSR
jgi:hypothetical protein